MRLLRNARKEVRWTCKLQGASEQTPETKTEFRLSLSFPTFCLGPRFVLFVYLFFFFVFCFFFRLPCLASCVLSDVPAMERIHFVPSFCKLELNCFTWDSDSAPHRMMLFLVPRVRLARCAALRQDPLSTTRMSSPSLTILRTVWTPTQLDLSCDTRVNAYQLKPRNFCLFGFFFLNIWGPMWGLLVRSDAYRWPSCDFEDTFSGLTRSRVHHNNDCRYKTLSPQVVHSHPFWWNPPHP